MRTVTFQSVLWGTARGLGLDPSRDLNSVRAATLTEYANQRVREGWQFDYWPEWTLVEQRYYRAAYSASENITAATERYHIGSGTYYQALRTQTPAAQAPATYASGAWTENSAYWAGSASSYDGADWATGTAYTVTNGAATIIRDPLTGNFYQVHTAHTAGATIDLTKMGLLTPLDRYVSLDQTGLTPIGEVKRACRRSPRVYPDRPGELQYLISSNGVQILPVQPAWIYLPANRSPNLIWLEFRTRPPVFDSTPYSATANVIVGDVRYYATTGECYKALAAQTPATAAPTDTTKWSKVDFPWLLAGWAKRAAAADALRDQKQTDRAAELLAQAQQELSDTRDRELASQGQYDRAEVQTYGS